MTTISHLSFDSFFSQMPFSEKDNNGHNSYIDINKLEYLLSTDIYHQSNTDTLDISLLSSTKKKPLPIFLIAKVDHPLSFNASTSSNNLPQESTNDSNEAFHSKDEVWNMMVKIRGKFHLFLKLAINECIKISYGKQRYKLYTIAGSFAKKINNKDNVNLFNKPISYLFTHSLEKGKKEKENEKLLKNKRTIERLSKRKEFKNIFSMTYIESFNQLFKNTNDLEIKEKFHSFAEAFIKNRNYIYDKLKGKSESTDKVDKAYVKNLFMMLNNFEKLNPKRKRKAKFVISKINK